MEPTIQEKKMLHEMRPEVDEFLTEEKKREAKRKREQVKDIYW